VQQVKLADMMHKKTFTIDLSKPDKVKKDMFSSFLQEPQEEGDEIDTAEVKADIDNTVASYLKAGLTLTDDNKFRMVSNGLIVPASIPGWHFGDTLEGEWAKTNDVLTFSVGENEQGYTWKFKILHVTSKRLRLQEISQGAIGTNNMLNSSINEIEFVRE
jgi:hypothetical protein